MCFSPSRHRGTIVRWPRRSRSLLVLLVLIVGVPTRTLQAQSPAGSDVLATLRVAHPRLYVNDEEMSRVEQGLRVEPLLRAWHDRLQQEAAKILDEPPVVHELIGPRLLHQSRRALDRIATLAGLYRLDGDRRKLDRAVVELRTAAAFPDWNPSHFLDTAEMTNALAIGYDWLFDDLSESDRATIRRAIVELGLKPGLNVYESGRGWPNSRHNWNQVCNGGMVAGALAIADEEPELARSILEHSKSIARAMASFAPDGGWAEGPGYWSYATKYNVFYLDSLRTALGTDFGLLATPGFSTAGEFRMHAVGPIGRTFNFADAGDRAGSAPQMLWLARTFDRPDFARHEIGVVGDRPEIWHLLYTLGSIPATSDTTPPNALFRGIDVAFLRTARDDPEATYVGFKGGDNKANHSHLDLGTFVLDALGHRWVVELGVDDYNLPGYFGKERWTYYRLKTEGQNTLTIDGRNQDPKAEAPMVAFRGDPGRGFAVADLTAAYAPKVQRAFRGVAQQDGNSVLIQDEVTTVEPVEIVWAVHVPKEVEVRDDRAVITQGDNRMVALLLDPPGARFAVESADPPPPQRQNPDVRRVVVRVPDARGTTRIAVLFVPNGPLDGTPSLAIEPLDDWVRTAPLADLDSAE